MFFARPFSAEGAELLVLIGLGLWTLLLLPGPARTVAWVRRICAIVSPLAIALGGYALAYKTETMIQHHRFLDLTTQASVNVLLQFAIGGTQSAGITRRLVGVVAIAALSLRAAIPSSFFEALRLGLLTLNVVLFVAVAAGVMDGLRRTRPRLEAAVE